MSSHDWAEVPITSHPISYLINTETRMFSCVSAYFIVGDYLHFRFHIHAEIALQGNSYLIIILGGPLAEKIKAV